MCAVEVDSAVIDIPVRREPQGNINIVVFNLIIFIIVSREGVVLKIGVGVPQVVGLNSPSNTVTLWVLNISN